MASKSFNPQGSDYLDAQHGKGRAPSPHPNDRPMAQKRNPASDAINAVVNSGMGGLGYDTTRRTNTDENDFYRNYAEYMPGYEIDGIPSGAWAQDRATNHVGQGSEGHSPWEYVRQSLVEQESSMIEERLGSGEDPNLSFGDVYGAHANAYDGAHPSGASHNTFIDPASFALAVYGAPVLEAVGVDSGPITGASIDLFNDPTDTATAGWAKRMGLSVAEMAVCPMLGAFTAAYNTHSALTDGHMLDEWQDAGAEWLGGEAREPHDPLGGTENVGGEAPAP